MPVAAPRPCRKPGCPKLSRSAHGYCEAHAHIAQERVVEAKRRHDERRGSARERGYDSRWDKARKTFLRTHPLCRMCEAQGRVTPATVVDHIIPHKGDQALFWDTGNWQPLCTHHHNSAKQREERGGPCACGPDGMPTDPRHPWGGRGKSWERPAQDR